MITINKIEDLKKYVKIVPADKYDGKHKQIIFEFIENGEKADVIFDCAVDLVYECQKVSKKDYECCVYVKAKTITFNYSFTCNKIFADELIIKDWCECDSILIHKNISGNFLKCERITCISSIDCKEIYTQKIHCKNIKTQRLDIDNKIRLTNLSCDKVEFI